jgi:hypothetical protein
MKARKPGRAASRLIFATAPRIALASVFLFFGLAVLDGRLPDRTAERVVPLFTVSGEETPGPSGGPPGTLRSRRVEVNPLFSGAGRIEPGMRVAAAPFEGRSFTAVLEESRLDVNGVRSFRASVEGTENGFLILSSADGFILGLADIPEWGMRFELAPDLEQAGHVVRDIDPRAAQAGELDDGPAPIPAAGDVGPAAFSSAGPAAAADAEANVDLMIVYTSAAAAWASGVGGINLVISQAVQLSQQAFDNSQAGIRLRLVFSSQVGYQESGSSNTDLNRLTTSGDGYLDEVHGWRNLHGADMVNLLADVDDVGGLAWLLTNPAGRPQYAFSLVRVRQAAGGYTLVHELGHNFGCHHRKDQTDQPGPGIYSYSAGWRWQGANDVRYCSVMSYTDAWDGHAVSRVGYFSSPVISHMGAPTGSAADGDNARTLRDTKGVVSTYRAEASGDTWLTIRATEGGTTVPAPGNYSYSRGSVVQVTAQPFAHYLFTGWSGHATGAANPVAITMSESKSVTANFQRIIYAPSNARGVKVLNRSLSQAEYINVLTWEANPDNADIVNYRIYRVEGPQKTMLTYVDSNVFEYRERRVERDRVYTYWIVAVNAEWREGAPAEVVVQ